MELGSTIIDFLSEGAYECVCSLLFNTYLIVFIFVCLAVPTFTSGRAKFFYTRFYILNNAPIGGRSLVDEVEKIKITF